MSFYNTFKEKKVKRNRDERIKDKTNIRKGKLKRKKLVRDTKTREYKIKSVLPHGCAVEVNHQPFAGVEGDGVSKLDA